MCENKKDALCGYTCVVCGQWVDNLALHELYCPGCRTSVPYSHPIAYTGPCGTCELRDRCKNYRPCFQPNQPMPR